ncbi:MAG: hypothetical protein ACLTL6_14795 [Holdemanella porci]
MSSYQAGMLTIYLISAAGIFMLSSLVMVIVFERNFDFAIGLTLVGLLLIIIVVFLIPYIFLG